MHRTIREYLDSMVAEGRASTVPSYERGLRRFEEWLGAQHLDPLSVTTEILREFQQYLSHEYKKPDGQPLKRSTQATWLSAVKSYYGHLYARGQVLADPAEKIRLPVVRRRKVACDHLSQQEAIAFLESQAKRVAERKEGTLSWATEYRNLALLALAFATGRRRSALRDIRIEHLDLERREMRVPFEKGRHGKVLPCARWALEAAADFAKRARPILLGGRPDQGWLFLGYRTERICGEYLGRLLREVQQRVAGECPDLDELPGKRLSAHSTRVSFAVLMFLNGAGIRVVNDLLLHKQLSTSARYTPLALEDLRRCLRGAHPRA